MELREIFDPMLSALRPDALGPLVAPTARELLFRDGPARLYRLGPKADGDERGQSVPVLLVPSLINRWYILDLRRGQSVAQGLVDAGHEVFLLDWGTPRPEDRFFDWDDVVARLHRAIRKVRRLTGTRGVALVGYCVGGTLSGICTALHPDDVAALVNLAGPFDFSHAGHLGLMADARWFDAEAIASTGNVSGLQLQSAFIALRPTAQLGKWLGFAERFGDAEAREAFAALELWANDNVSFPAAAYATYIRELYQENALVQGRHRVGGRLVDLRNVACPVLTIAADKDVICPPAAARGLPARVSSAQRDEILLGGGHVGAVVGGRAARELYPRLGAWLHANAPSDPRSPS